MSIFHCKNNRKQHSEDEDEAGDGSNTNPTQANLGGSSIKEREENMSKRGPCSELLSGKIASEARGSKLSRSVLGLRSTSP